MSIKSFDLGYWIGAVLVLVIWQVWFWPKATEIAKEKNNRGE